MKFNPSSKIMTLAQAAEWARALRQSGKRLAGTNGVFDLLHRGHVEYLCEAASETDALLVAMNSDSSVHAIKGPDRPIVPEQDRAYLLASLECVSAVVLFDGPRATEVFRAIPLDLYVKGGDYTEESLDAEEHAALVAGGAAFRFIPLIAGRSTTSIVKQIRGDAVLDTSGDNPIKPILARRSVRKFQPRPVGKEYVQKLLEAAMAAPSACHKDPWEFHVVQQREILDAMADSLPNGPFLREVSLAIVIAGRTENAAAGKLSYLVQDCSAAQENLLLAASLLGLGACWLGVHPNQDRIEALSRLLNLPEGTLPITAVAIGWPAEQPPARTRFLSEKVHFIPKT